MTVRTSRGQEKSAFGQEFDEAHRENSGRAPSVSHREVANSMLSTWLNQPVAPKMSATSSA
jgi:hypothetical protein